MKRAVLLLAIVLVAVLPTSCAPGPNAAVGEGEDVAGFWLGLWHGFIVLFKFIVSLFNDNVSIYEVNNNGDRTTSATSQKSWPSGEGAEAEPTLAGRDASVTGIKPVGESIAEPADQTDSPFGSVNYRQIEKNYFDNNFSKEEMFYVGRRKQSAVTAINRRGVE